MQPLRSPLTARLRQQLLQPRTPLILFALLFLLLFIRFEGGPVVGGDAGKKILQVRDFVAHDLRSFQCHYPGSAFDPDFRFFPFNKPFIYTLPAGDGSHGVAGGERCYYTFPLFVTLLWTPAYLAGGVYGIRLLSLAAAWSILALMLLAMRRLDFAEADQALGLYLAGLGMALANYGLNPNEFALTAALALAAICAPLWRSSWALLLAGVSGGLAVWLRPDAVLVVGAVVAAPLLWRRSGSGGQAAWSLLRPLLYALPLGAMVVAMAAINYSVFGHIFGIRAFELDEAHGGHSLAERLIALYRYWLGNPEALLIRTPFFWLSLAAAAALFKPRLWSSSGMASGCAGSAENTNSLQRRRLALAGLLIAALPAAMLIPFLWADPGHGGPRFAERHLFNSFAPLFLAGLILMTLRERWPSPARWPSLTQRVALPLVFLLTLLTFVPSIPSLRLSATVDREISGGSLKLDQAASDFESEAVILRQAYTVEFINHSFHRQRYFLATNDEAFRELIANLREGGIERISVLHSRPPFRGRGEFAGHSFDFPETLVPEDFDYQSESDDYGDILWELRHYRL